MSTTFNYEIYFSTELSDEESTEFCSVMDQMTLNPKLLIWQAIGNDFIKGFVEYYISDLDKENAVKYFIECINKIEYKNYKFEIKNCG